MKQFLTLIFLIAFAFTSRGQGQECLQLEAPEFELSDFYSEEQIQMFMNPPPLDTVTISCVVHIWHKSNDTDTSQWITDERVESQFDLMNKTWAGDTTVVRPGSGTLPLKLILAPKDEDNVPTTAIVHHVQGVDFNFAEFDSLGWCINHFADIDGNDTAEFYNHDASVIAHQWNPLLYFNIHLAEEINNNGGGSSIQAYAYVHTDNTPEAVPAPPNPSFDRNVSLLNNWGFWPDYPNDIKSWDASYTAAHEMAHSLGLFHSAGICVEDDCTTQGDRVCDTDPDVLSSSSCETANPCFGNTIGNIEAYWRSNQVDQHCKDHFTVGQAERMSIGLSYRQFQNGGQDQPPQPNVCDQEQIPYDLQEEFGSNGWTFLEAFWDGWLDWDSAGYDKKCQIIGNKVGAPDEASFVFTDFQTESAFIVYSYTPLLQDNTEYRWKIRCSCNELLSGATEWSEYSYFIYSLPEEGNEMISIKDMDLEMKGDGKSWGDLDKPVMLSDDPDGIYDLYGRMVHEFAIIPRDLPSGLYIIIEDGVIRRQFHLKQ